MTQSTTIKPTAPARSKAAPVSREPRRGAAPPTAEELLTLLRATARVLVPAGEAQRDLALKLVETNFRIVSDACPVTENLRPWQLLASDLAAALSPVDEARAQRARRLADEIRATVVMIARNPADQLAIRPASKQLLLALEAAQGRVEHSVLRERCGISGPNFSNLLKPLRAHGLVNVVPGPENQRSKLVILTRKGQEALDARTKPAEVPAEPYQSYIERTDPVAAAGIYSPELAVD